MHDREAERAAKLGAIEKQIKRVLVLGAPRDDEQREVHTSELTAALEQFLVQDIETGVTQLVQDWTRGKGWPLPSDVIGAVRQARKSRFDRLPPERRPERDPQAVCRCGAVPRHALLSQVDPDSGEKRLFSRIIAPCDERWHKSRGQGYVPLPPNFEGWVEEINAQPAPEPEPVQESLL